MRYHPKVHFHADPTKPRREYIDAKGRPPQDMTIQVVTPVTFSVEFAGVPIEKLGVVEVNTLENCKAFSVTENKPMECTSQSAPQ